MPQRIGWLMFAGMRARSADIEMLRRARRMAGCDPREIWGETGWFVGLDGQWRWEIDDSAAELRSCSRWDRAPMVLDHPELYHAYEYVRHAVVRVRLRPGAETAGIYRPGMTATAVHCARHAQIFLEGDSAASARSAALHELQHAVQDHEEFAPGSSREVSSWEDYIRSPGEAEARTVEARIELTSAQRRAAFPLDSYDVPLAWLQGAEMTEGYQPSCYVPSAVRPAPADGGQRRTHGPTA